MRWNGIHTRMLVIQDCMLVTPMLVTRMLVTRILVTRVFITSMLVTYRRLVVWTKGTI